MIEVLDRNLAHFAAIVERDLGVAIKDQPGSGAAGGLGGGLVAFAGGKLEPGINLVIDAVNLADRLENADLCLTGEGAIDAQSASARRPSASAASLTRSAVRSWPWPARSAREHEATLEHGLDAYFSICPGPITLDEAIARTAELLEDATVQAMRAFLAGRTRKDPSRKGPA